MTFRQNEMEFKSIVINSTGHADFLGAAKFLRRDCVVGFKLLAHGDYK